MFGENRDWLCKTDENKDVWCCGLLSFLPLSDALARSLFGFVFLPLPLSFIPPLPPSWILTERRTSGREKGLKSTWALAKNPSLLFQAKSMAKSQFHFQTSSRLSLRQYDGPHVTECYFCSSNQSEVFLKSLQHDTEGRSRNEA